MDVIFERAKLRLERMSVVGVVERLDETVDSLANYLCLPRPAFTPLLNVARSNSRGAIYRHSGLVSDDLARRIDQITSYDRQLYAHACKLMDACTSFTGKP